MKITKKDAPVIFRGLIVLGVFCLLAVSVAVLMNNSVAWFAENDGVDANGNAVALKDYGITAEYSYTINKYGQTQTAEKTLIETWEQVFNDLAPGDTVTIEVIYTNQDNEEKVISAAFCGEEVPIIKTVTSDNSEETRYFYLGTQLKITNITLPGGTAESLGILDYIMTPPQNQIYYTSSQTVSDYQLFTQAALTANGTLTLTFTVEFVNLDIDQNDYQGFGKTEDGAEALASGSFKKRVITTINSLDQ